MKYRRYRVMDRVNVHDRAWRRAKGRAHQQRRLKGDRNQHYNDLACGCWTDPKIIARFKDTPCACSCYSCGNPRKWQPGWRSLTVQELRALQEDGE